MQCKCIVIFFLRQNKVMAHLNRLVIVGATAVVLIGLIAWYNKQRNETFYTGPDSQTIAGAGGYQMAKKKDKVPSSMMSGSAVGETFAPFGMEPVSNEKHMPTGVTDTSVSESFTQSFPNDTIVPSDLLPKNATNTEWAKMNPAGQGDVSDQNFLTAGYMLGYNTQGTSLRNASHDLRAEPANPRKMVSIWSQSTIDPDLNRRPLC
jgi:hypothetical protein